MPATARAAGTRPQGSQRRAGGPAVLAGLAGRSDSVVTSVPAARDARRVPADPASKPGTARAADTGQGRDPGRTTASAHRDQTESSARAGASARPAGPAAKEPRPAMAAAGRTAIADRRASALSRATACPLATASRAATVRPAARAHLVVTAVLTSTVRAMDTGQAGSRRTGAGLRAARHRAVSFPSPGTARLAPRCHGAGHVRPVRAAPPSRTSQDQASRPATGGAEATVPRGRLETARRKGSGTGRGIRPGMVPADCRPGRAAVIACLTDTGRRISTRPRRATSRRRGTAPRLGTGLVRSREAPGADRGCPPILGGRTRPARPGTDRTRGMAATTYRELARLGGHGRTTAGSGTSRAARRPPAASRAAADIRSSSAGTRPVGRRLVTGTRRASRATWPRAPATPGGRMPPGQPRARLARRARPARRPRCRPVRRRAACGHPATRPTPRPPARACRATRAGGRRRAPRGTNRQPARPGRAVRMLTALLPGPRDRPARLTGLGRCRSHRP